MVGSDSAEGVCRPGVYYRRFFREMEKLCAWSWLVAHFLCLLPISFLVVRSAAEEKGSLSEVGREAPSSEQVYFGFCIFQVDASSARNCILE